MLLNIEIIEEFLGDYSTRATGSYIAKKKNLNQKTVANHLAALENEGIMKSRTMGKNKEYHLNLDNREILRHYILAAEHIRTLRFHKKNMIIRDIAEKMNKNIDGSALIFGSYAKGIHKQDSDLDVLVIGRCNEEEIDKISEMFNIEINVKSYRKITRDTLTEEALNNHIFIKGPEKVIEAMLDAKH